jgi:hypothetical protein
MKLITLEAGVVKVILVSRNNIPKLFSFSNTPLN